jgi:hypothetical protein
LLEKRVIGHAGEPFWSGRRTLPPERLTKG